MITLTTEARTTFGKDLKAARAAGRLPVIVYGPKEAALSLFVDTKAFKKVLAEAGESSIISLETPNGVMDILIHEVDHHPVSGEPVHADLYAVEKGKAITVNVPLVFEGVVPAVKELGGILVKVLHELEIEAMAKDLPHDLKVDLTKLVAIDSQILVSDIKLPAGVKTSAEPEEVVAAISVAVEESEEPAAPVDLSAIEVEKKGKKEEEGAADGEAAAA